MKTDHTEFDHVERRYVTTVDVRRWAEAYRSGVRIANIDPSRPHSVRKHLIRCGVHKANCTDWSDEETETLRRMWGTASCAEIAAVIGRSRNAIIGRDYRLGLSKSRAPP